jgi:hypothetical protein
MMECGEDENEIRDDTHKWMNRLGAQREGGGRLIYYDPFVSFLLLF